MSQSFKQVCVLLKQSRHVCVCCTISAATTAANCDVTGCAIDLMNVKNKCCSTCLAEESTSQRPSLLYPC